MKKQEKEKVECKSKLESRERRDRIRRRVLLQSVNMSQAERDWKAYEDDKAEEVKAEKSKRDKYYKHGGSNRTQKKSS